MRNNLLERFKDGKKTLGTFTMMGSSIAVECLGYSGLDYALIDTEHSPVGPDAAASYIAAAQLGGLTPLVRVNEISRSPVLRMLDAGAQGLVVPCVESMEQIQALVSFAKYAPLGNRGFCPTRDGAWGFASHACGAMEDYMEFCNSETLLLPQCETRGCLDQIEAIAAVPGVDGIFVGPYDLSIALGKPGQFGDPEVSGAIDRVLKACKAAGKLSVIFTGSAEAASGYFAQGFDSVTLGLDTAVYINAYRALTGQVKR